MSEVSVMFTVLMCLFQWNTRIILAEVATNHDMEVITCFPHDEGMIIIAPVSLNKSGAKSDKFINFFLKKRKNDEPIAYDLMWDEANEKMGHARTVRDFTDAARVYYYLVQAGIRNGDLFYNLGIALLLAGQYKEALMAFIRAERYLGTKWEIKQNISASLAGQMKSWSEWHKVWYRYVFPWHYRLGLHLRSMIAVCGLFIMLAGLCLRFLFKLRYGIMFIALGFLLAVTFVPSVIMTVAQEVADTSPVVFFDN